MKKKLGVVLIIVMDVLCFLLIGAGVWELLVWKWFN